MINKNNERNSSKDKGLDYLRSSLNNAMTNKLEEMEEEVIARAIRQMMSEDDQKHLTQKLH